MMLRFTDKPLTQNEISEKLLVDKSNVTGLMDNMEKLGLIKRQEVAGDRRSYHIHLMPEGRKLIDKLNQIYETKVKNIMSSFSGKEQIELIKLTRKLRIALNESAERK
jgi:DNA-binding MarR family transcriptional regulator